MAWLKGFTYDGIDSLDYDLYITSGSVYDAPERVVDMIKVPGRNGNLAIDRGKFENIDVEYNVYTKDRSQTSFAQNIRDFRNELCSRHEYLRLTDDYNSDEFRLGIYKSGLELDADIDRAGAIKLTFDCKPQRFLTSGETERSIPEWSDLHTDSGSLVTVDNSIGDYAVKSLSTGIVPQQSGSGDPSPTNIRPITGFDSVSVTRTGKNLLGLQMESATIYYNGTTASGDNNRLSLTTTSTSTWRNMSLRTWLKAGTYTLSLKAISTDDYVPVVTVYNDSGSAIVQNIKEGTPKSFTLNEYQRVEFRFFVSGSPGAIRTVTYYDVQLELGTTATAYEPYQGITYTTALGRTVYGGTLDVVSGQLTVERAFITLDETANWSWSTATLRPHVLISGMEIKGAVISNMYPYSSSNVAVDGTITTNAGSGNDVWIYDTVNAPDLNSWKTFVASNNLQVVYTLATPLTYQLTATQVAFLLGTNNIWSNTGDISIEYGKGGNTLFNPTLFDSRPLIELTGAGTLGINNYIITITGSGKLYIDCDTMEAYTITGGIVTSANNRVSLNTTDYPVLRSGINSFAVGTGISNVKITPRWWRV